MGAELDIHVGDEVVPAEVLDRYASPPIATARVAELGAGEILLTSMDRDGTRDGFDLDVTRLVTDAVPVPVIASGGVGNLQHLVEGVTEGHADAVLAASIFHFGEHRIADAKAAMTAAGVTVRPVPASHR